MSSASGERCPSQSGNKWSNDNNEVQPNFVAGNHFVKVSIFGVFLARIFPHSDRMRRDKEKCGKMRTRKTPNTDTFHKVNINHFHKNWKKTTNDHNILTIIQYSLKINFIEKLNNQNFPKLAHGILETDKIPHEVFLNSIIKSFEILC